MNTEKDEMGHYKSQDEIKVEQMFNEAARMREEYKDIPKDELIDRLVFADMLLDSFQEERLEHSTELWYFVSDETGVKYLSDEEPKVYFMAEKGVPQPDKDGVYKFKPNKIWLTDGEINIRVPKCMEGLFPEMKYGDAPQKIGMSIFF